MQLDFPTLPEGLTKAEQRIVTFIQDQTDRFLFMTISELALTLKISEATLSRFAKHIGCKDYKAMKRLVLSQSTEQGPAHKMAATLNQASGFSPKAWLLQQMQNIEKTVELLDDASFTQAIQAILDAEHVYIHAKSASAALGQLMYFRLRRQGFPVTLLPSGGSEIFEGLTQVKAKDLVVFFSFSKVSHESRVILEHSREVGYQTLCFTSRTFSPTSEQGDINLLVYRGEEKAYHSSAAPAALVDALVVALSEKMPTQSTERLSQMHRLKRRYF